jgi:purine-nucleoside phosphorylase
LTPLRPRAPIAADALLPGYPARALHLAQELLESPKMSNHAHGLWGYGGSTAEGLPLTIQSIGIGPDPRLGAALAEAAAGAGVRPVSVTSADLVGRLDGRPAEDWARRGAVAIEMASAALFAAGPRCGVAVAGLLAVADAGEDSIGDQALLEASMRMGGLAIEALSSSR